MRLDRYEVGDEIGAGASARVCRGFDTELKRPVAIKIMHPHLRGKGSFAERFRREAQAVATLQHPNIVRIYDVAPESAEDLYFVAELMEGGTVAEWLAQEPGSKLPHEIALCVGIQVLRGLEAAHRAGVVHRDLKPENLMLSGEGEVKIADFGIARTGDAELTQTGSLMGSPAYMAPEQIEGAAIDARTDLFAFGVVLFRMLTGRLPFGEGTVVQILQRIANGDHTPIRDLEPSLDPRIANLVEQCLIVGAEQRPASAKNVRDRLAEVLKLRGVDEPAEEIFSYRLGNPETAKRRQYDLVESLVNEARELLKTKTDPALAMALVDRALEIQPFHFEAYRLLQQSGPSKRKKAALIIAGLLAVILLMVGGWYAIRALEPDSGAGNVRVENPVAASLPPVQLPVEAPVEAKEEKDEVVTENLRQPSPVSNTQPAVTPPVEDNRPAKSVAIRSAPAQATLLLVTRPWADVYLDGADEKTGTTPLLRELKLSPGRHTIRLMNPHAHFVEFDVELGPGERIQKIVELPLLPGLLQVVAGHDEQVFLDGKPVAADSLREPLQIPHGEYTVRFVRAGEPQEVPVEVIAGRQVEVRSPFGAMTDGR
jgi:serine/threonine-protein kinase